MPRYRRRVVPGGTYFFTVVTNRRLPLFADEVARACLRRAVREARSRRCFETLAFCLLPDHLHCVWRLPEGGADFASRWAHIKSAFSRLYHASKGHEAARSVRRKAKRETAFWQQRFWEHLIRDELDLARHVDYVHFNPVKHALVARAADWPWSTFHRHVREGAYDSDWGELKPGSIADLTCTGE